MIFANKLAFVFIGVGFLFCSIHPKHSMIITEFVPDSTINNILKLRSNSSAEEYIWSGIKLYSEGTFRVAVFSNNKSSQSLKVIHYPGDNKYSFSFFKVGQLNEEDLKNSTKLPYDFFQTESGIHLGMSKEDLVRLKGNNYSTRNESGMELLHYKLNNFKMSTFLKRYNMPSYSAVYSVKDGALVAFSFGFDNE